MTAGHQLPTISGSVEETRGQRIYLRQRVAVVVVVNTTSIERKKERKGAEPSRDDHLYWCQAAEGNEERVQLRVQRVTVCVGLSGWLCVCVFVIGVRAREKDKRTLLFGCVGKHPPGNAKENIAASL